MNATHLYQLICNAIRVLGHEPITPDASEIGAVCIIDATADPLDARLEVLANQFGMRWELEPSNVGYGFWVLYS